MNNFENKKLDILPLHLMRELVEYRLNDKKADFDAAETITPMPDLEVDSTTAGISQEPRVVRLYEPLLDKTLREELAEYRENDPEYLLDNKAALRRLEAEEFRVFKQYRMLNAQNDIPSNLEERLIKLSDEIELLKSVQHKSSNDINAVEALSEDEVKQLKQYRLDNRNDDKVYLSLRDELDNYIKNDPNLVDPATIERDFDYYKAQQIARREKKAMEEKSKLVGHDYKDKLKKFLSAVSDDKAKKKKLKF